MKKGYSLLETMVAMAIMALAMTFVMPRAGVMLDRMTLHAVFFDFQRQVSDLRREAYRSQQALQIVAQPGPAPYGEPRRVRLKPSWSYSFSRPLTISAGGVCRGGGEVLIRRDNQPMMKLQPSDDVCHFTRLE